MERNDSLDGIRAYGVLCVVIHHAILMINGSMAESIRNVPIYAIDGFYNKIIKFIFMLFNGVALVPVFFMLSGFVLFRSLLFQAKKNKQFISLTFIIKRLCRIYIPMIVSLLLFYGLFLILSLLFPSMYHRINLDSLLYNCALYKIAVNGATWSLQAEAISIIFILIAFYTYINLGIHALLLLTFIAIASLDNSALQFGSLGIHTWLYMFFVGFLCALCPSQAFKNVLSTLGWKFPLLCLLFMRGFFYVHSITGILFESFCACYLLIYLDANLENTLSQFLCFKKIQFMGKLSYSFYLLNVIFLNVFLPFTFNEFVQKHPLEFGLLITILVYIITTPISYYFERYVEQPCTGFAKKLSEKIVALLQPEIKIGDTVRSR
jgi:peptidoglycan/LPS O-acetylase OafA/YrhL